MLYVDKWVFALDKGSQTITPPLSTQINNGMESHLNTACWKEVTERHLATWVNNYMLHFLHTHSIYTHAWRKNLHNVTNCTVSTVNGHILCWYIAWFTWNGWNEVKTVLRDQTLSHGTAINNQHGHYLGCLLLNGPHTWFESAYPRHVHLKLVSLHCLKSLPTQLTQQWLLTSLINKEMSVPSGMVLRDV